MTLHLVRPDPRELDEASYAARSRLMTHGRHSLRLDLTCCGDDAEHGPCVWCTDCSERIGGLDHVLEQARTLPGDRVTSARQLSTARADGTPADVEDRIRIVTEHLDHEQALATSYGSLRTSTPNTRWTREDADVDACVIVSSLELVPEEYVFGLRAHLASVEAAYAWQCDQAGIAPVRP